MKTLENDKSKDNQKINEQAAEIEILNDTINDKNKEIEEFKIKIDEILDKSKKCQQE